LVEFKKGAFVGLGSIKPIAVKYETKMIEASYSYMSIFYNCLLLGMMNPSINLKIKEYPVFKPNEYFWKNHWQ
jgi:hypothetical protein